MEPTSSEVPSVKQLRSRPDEWHRRGMRHPVELARIVADRVAQNVSPDARYQDFLVAPDDEDATITGHDR